MRVTLDRAHETKQREKKHDTTREPVCTGTRNTLIFFSNLVKGMPEPDQKLLASVMTLCCKTEKDFDHHHVSKFMENRQKNSDDVQKNRSGHPKTTIKKLFKEEIVCNINKNKPTPVMTGGTEEMSTDSIPNLAMTIKLLMVQATAPPITQVRAQ